MQRSLQESGDARQRIIAQAKAPRYEDQAVGVLAESEMECNRELVRRPSRRGPEIHNVREMVFEDPKGRRSLGSDEEGGELIAGLG